MTYKPRTIPMKHQTEALRRTAERATYPSDADVFADLMEMGTGKSAVTVYEWQQRVDAKDLNDLMILAPKGCYRNWYADKSDEQQSEITTHLDPALREKMVVAGWRGGKTKAQKQEITHLLGVKGRPRMFVVNIEALSTVEKAYDACAEFLSRGTALIAIDESTTIKGNSWRSERAIALGGMARARRILTGLVTPKSPMDLFRQFQFLDWRILGFQSFYAFRARYAVLQRQEIRGRMVPIIVGYRNVDELHQKIQHYSYRCLKEDCLDLPPKVYERREIELTGEQRRIYKDLLENATAALGDEKHVTATIVIALIMRLQQLVCGHVVDEQGGVHEVDEKRTDALLELLEEHQGKAVVWFGFTHSLEKVAERLRKEYGSRSVACFWGGNTSTRGEDEKRFLSDPECLFMLSTPSAGGRGNTWVVADLEVYYSNTYDLEMRSQSEDRLHRKGQKNKVTIVDLVAPGTVDEKILKALRKKIDLASVITGDGYREWLI